MVDQKTLCIFHVDCVDGLGAAWSVHRALGKNVEFVAAKYGEYPIAKYGKMRNGEWYFGALKGRDVLIVDFSYPLPVLLAMAQEARSVLVLDHHKTAQEDLDELPPPMIGAEPGTPGTWRDWVKAGPLYVGPNGNNLAAIFDLDRSGAGLTWDYLNPGIARPRIIDLIEDRDLWRFKFGDETRAFHAALTAWWSNDLLTMFKYLDRLHEAEPGPYLRSDNFNWHEMLCEGRAILRANAQATVSAVAASRRTIKIAGHIVPCANVPHDMASDAGHLLCQRIILVDAPPGLALWASDGHWACPFFSATYYDGADGRRHFSLRSPEGGANVGAIAKQMAGKFNVPFLDEHYAAIHEMNHGTYLGACPECEELVRLGKAVGPFAGGGHTHAAGFNAPLGWNGE